MWLINAFGNFIVGHVTAHGWFCIKPDNNFFIFFTVQFLEMNNQMINTVQHPTARRRWSESPNPTYPTPHGQRLTLYYSPPWWRPDIVLKNIYFPANNSFNCSIHSLAISSCKKPDPLFFLYMSIRDEQTKTKHFFFIFFHVVVYHFQWPLADLIMSLLSNKRINKISDLLRKCDMTVNPEILKQDFNSTRI